MSLNCRLVRTFLLIDGTTGITEEDRVGIEMMEEFGRPYAVGRHLLTLERLYQRKVVCNK